MLNRLAFTIAFLLTLPLFGQSEIQLLVSGRHWDNALKYQPSAGYGLRFSSELAPAWNVSLAAERSRTRQTILLPSGSSELAVTIYTFSFQALHLVHNSRHFQIAAGPALGWRFWQRASWSVALPGVGIYSAPEAGGIGFYGALATQLSWRMTDGLKLFAEPALEGWNQEKWWLNGRLSGGIAIVL